MDLRDLTDTIDQLAATDVADLADAESIEALQRQLARLDALVTGATAAFDTSGVWAPSGARTAASWLTTRCRISKGRARRMVRRGRELRHLPAFSRAWGDGDITVDQVDTVLAVVGPSTQSQLVRDQGILAEQAGTLRPDLFARAVDYWKQLADPDGVEADDTSRRARRDVYLDSSFLGMWLGKVTLDPISGAIVGEELDRLERALFEADWVEASEEFGTRANGRRPAPHSGSATRRRPGGNGHPQPGGPRRRAPASTLVHGTGRLRDPARPDL